MSKRIVLAGLMAAAAAFVPLSGASAHGWYRHRHWHGGPVAGVVNLGAGIVGDVVTGALAIATAPFAIVADVANAGEGGARSSAYYRDYGYGPRPGYSPGYGYNCPPGYAGYYGPRPMPYYARTRYVRYDRVNRPWGPRMAQADYYGRGGY